MYSEIFKSASGYGGLENFELVNFLGADFFLIFSGGYGEAYIFSRNSSIFVCDPCFNDYVILLPARILGMTLKGMVSVCSQ